MFLSILFGLLLCSYVSTIWFEIQIGSKTTKDLLTNLIPFGFWTKIILEVIELLRPPKKSQKENVKITPKQFALEQLAPYYKDPSICGITEEDNCSYLTQDGKMCVAGKNLTKKERENLSSEDVSIEHLLEERGEDILIPQARGILNTKQWGNLQKIHDAIARKDAPRIQARIRDLDLFILEELKQEANNLK